MNTAIEEMLDKVLDGRYKVEKHIGSGGMAQVYKGKDLLLERPVAIKILNAAFAEDNAFVTRFKGEAQAAGKLNHPNIVNMYDVGFDQGYHYIIMEYVDGITLKEYITQKGKLSVEESVKIAISIAEGLEQAHAMGIVHCDIKPHNIIITQNGTIKVTDFGIARAINSSETLMYTTSVMGSAHYLSPEQASGKPINGSTDMYSLGVVLYEMLTGRVPYEGESPISVALKHVNELLVPPSRYNRNIPPLLEAAVMKALEKKKENRFESITEMINDLRLSFGFAGGKNNRIQSHDFATKIMPAVKEQNINPVVHKKKEKKANFLDAIIQVPQKAIIVGACILFLIAFGCGYFMFGNFWSKVTVYVPNVVGKQEKIAEEMILSKNLKVDISEVANSDIPVGEVISTMPAAGTEVKEQRTIRLIVSRGSREFKMPKLTGINLEKAQTRLSALGVSINTITNKEDYSLPDGIILEQEPAADAKIDSSTKITLVVNTKSLKEVKMPKIEGLSLDEANKLLAKDHIQILINGDHDGKSLITEQNPQAGQTVKQGSSVTVNASLKKALQKDKHENRGTVTITVPKGSDNQRVSIVVVDNDGKRVIYDGKHRPNDIVERAISGVGNVRVKVYINDKLVQDQIL